MRAPAGETVAYDRRMNIIFLLLVAADVSHPGVGLVHVAIVSSDKAVPISRPFSALNDEPLCLTPCEVYLPPGAFAFFEGGVGSGYARHERMVWIPESGAEIVVSPGLTWQRPLGITLLATGIPAAASGGVLIFAGWLSNGLSPLFGNGRAGDEELAVGIGLAAAGTLAYVIGAVLLGSQGDAPLVRSGDGRVSFDGVALHF
jgi:hypothetical protein